jgi:hypothetical protein
MIQVKVNGPWSDFVMPLREHLPFRTGGKLKGDRGPATFAGRLPEWERPLPMAPTVRYVVYSYGTPIAWRDSESGWYVSETRHSVTTSKHQGRIRAAVASFAPHVRVRGEINVCDDCMFEHANGEHDPERSADLPRVWSLWDFRKYDMAMGGEHSERCTPEDRDEGCDCHEDPFSRMACEGCGDIHHGRRHTFTVFYR